MQWLLKELRGLRAPEREVLALCDWAGLSYAETAAVTGVPIGTVRSRIARARKHLRERAREAGGALPGAPAQPFVLCPTDLEDQP